MRHEKAPKRLAERATRVIGRLPDESRAEHGLIIEEMEADLHDRIKKASPSRVALMKLKLARLRAGFSLGQVAEKAGIDRGNLSRLENSVDNVDLNTLTKLADALGFDVVLDFHRRS